jgi:OOP family OmpA-OmpF porin
LRSEPGIVVVDASRGWSNWNISGLKDPTARQPEAVIAAAGIASPPIVGRWEPYLSLDPTLVAARARHSADSLKNIVDSERIMFDAGSAQLNSGAVATLAGVAAVVSQLDNAAAGTGSSVKLELTGRTDPTGADETNAALAERRVDAVASWLASSGIDARRLLRNPVATSSPLEASDPVERARINRSVSFKVDMTAAQATPGAHK